MMKLVFIGGKGSPSGLEVGKVYELPERYANLKYYMKAPEESEAGQFVPIPQPKRNEIRRTPIKKVTIPPGFTGTVKLRFNAKAKSAPSGYNDGQVYELSARYAKYPWFDLAEEISEVKVENIEDYPDQSGDKTFLPEEIKQREPLQEITLEELKHPQSISLPSQGSAKKEKPKEPEPEPEKVTEKTLQPPAKPQKPLKEYTRDELAVYLKNKGVEVKEGATKRELLIEAIKVA